MACRRVLSQSLSHRLTRLTLGANTRCPPHHTSTVRFFSKDGEDDPFGVNFEDGADKTGPSDALPPRYKRDAATGRLTGAIEQELSAEEKRILKADPLERDQLLLRRVREQFAKNGTEKETGLPEELDEMGKRVREAEMGLNVIGRSAAAQAAEEELDDGSALGRDESGFTQNLTKSEFEAFQEFMKSKHDIDIEDDDMPVQTSQKSRLPSEEDPDSKELSLKWLTSRAQRQMDDLLDDNPYSDLMPGDLSPARLVNRKRAKQIPPALLHHNNIDLLKRYLTPTGQIMNRVQTRLGARDQRRIAKLIKRARSLGLLPYVGQFKSEQHGWKHAKDIHNDRPWEKELKQRGLVIKPRHGQSDE